MALSGFFAVGQDTFIRACNLGINEAAALLVLARGTGADNATSRWSAEAASKRLHVRWPTADKAIKSLTRAKIISRVKTERLPTYKITKRGELIWLPNTLVDGAAMEMSPIARIRQTQDPMCLRLFIELYRAQNLREDGGISPEVVYKKYERKRLGQRGQFVVWSFESGGYSVRWGPVTRPHYREFLTEEEEKENKNTGVDFFRRFDLLLSLGLVQWVPYLYEGPEGEPIHPIWHGSDIPEERLVADRCERAAYACLTEGQASQHMDHSPNAIIAPVFAHIEMATLLGVARLRYRPWTNLTSAWWAETHDKCTRYATLYEGTFGTASTEQPRESA